MSVSSVASFLRRNSIVTSNEWIEACIQFVNQELSSSVQSLENLVFQQWLEADLEEIGVPCLPSEISTAQKLILNDSYALQVQGIRDIGRPAYAQLKEFEQSDNSNAQFSSAPGPTLPPWESKPSRMLLVNLTDGCHNIQGMEYKPLASFSPNLPPGVKILIKGPVECRFGILLLTSENVKVLGGEVENKLERFSRKSLLREILQLPNIEEDIVDASAISLPPYSSHPDSISSEVTVVMNNHMTSTRTSNRNSSFPDRRPSTPRGTQASLNQHTTNNSRSSDDVEMFENEEDDFEEGLDYGALDEIEQECVKKSNSFETSQGEEDVWLEDEDVVRDMMVFQDNADSFEMPFLPNNEPNRENNASRDIFKAEPFTYLSLVLKNVSQRKIVTIKGFIITVLSKLECTVDKGWSLSVRINDGTATLDASIHDKVLEEIIGVPAPEMVKMQHQAANDPEIRREVTKAISKCKATLKDYNCLMDIEFKPNSKPILLKCRPISTVEFKQLYERVRASSL